MLSDIYEYIAFTNHTLMKTVKVIIYGEIVVLFFFFNFFNLNINSIGTKFGDLRHMINGNIDVLRIVETKIDASFASAQFSPEDTIHDTD